MKEGNFEGLKPVNAEGGQVYAEKKNWSEEFLSTLNTLEKQNPEFAGTLAGLLPEDHDKFEQMLNMSNYSWITLSKLNPDQQGAILERIQGGLDKKSLAEIAEILDQ